MALGAVTGAAELGRCKGGGGRQTVGGERWPEGVVQGGVRGWRGGLEPGNGKSDGGVVGNGVGRE